MTVKHHACHSTCYRYKYINHSFHLSFSARYTVLLLIEFVINSRSNLSETQAELLQR